MMDLQRNVLRCLDCGKCTSACPVARYNGTLSPRRLMGRMGNDRHAGSDEGIWNCLTCMTCDSICPQEVAISRSMPTFRRQARDRGDKPPFTRCSAIESVTVLQSQADLQQDRLQWLTPDLKVDPRSRTLLWVGCAPYFDTFFADNGVRTLDAVTGAIRILNSLDIAPAVRAEERCCGHDALWGGDEATFERLAELNLKWLEDAAPERVITTCPECCLTLIQEYQRRFGHPTGEVIHISEFIAEQAPELGLHKHELKVSFEDPCRLGRHQGKYDAPRKALAAIPGLELREMSHSRHRAACCSGNWLSCSQASKKIQTDLLQDAAGTGSEMLVTACPKCLIHLKCAQAGEDGAVPEIEIRDLATVVADALHNGTAQAESTKRG